MNAIIPVYVHTKNFIADRVDVLKENKEQGDFVQYAALIVLAVLILAALVALVPSKLSNGIGSQIGKIFNGGK